MAADTLDVITIAEAKTYLGIASSDTSQDTPLQVYVTAVSRRLDTLCGSIVVRTHTTEHHPGGLQYITVNYRPISSVTTLTEYQLDGTSQALTAETAATKQQYGYWVDDEPKFPRRIYRRSSGLNDCFPRGGLVEVTYVSGRAANTAGVDVLFKQGAAIMLAQLWRREQGIGSDTFGAIDTMSGGSIPTFAVPRAVLELLAEEIRPPGVA